MTEPRTEMLCHVCGCTQELCPCMDGRDPVHAPTVSTWADLGEIICEDLEMAVRWGLTAAVIVGAAYWLWTMLP